MRIQFKLRKQPQSNSQHHFIKEVLGGLRTQLYFDQIVIQYHQPLNLTFRVRVLSFYRDQSCYLYFDIVLKLGTKCRNSTGTIQDQNEHLNTSFV